VNILAIFSISNAACFAEDSRDDLLPLVYRCFAGKLKSFAKKTAGGNGGVYMACQRFKLCGGLHGYVVSSSYVR